MNTKVYDISGKEKGTVELSDSVFNITPNRSAIYYALHAELSNRRQGTASTKSRSEVSGTGRKPFRQKGTGRARAGSYQSPVRVGGGIAFGPQPRGYRISLPRKTKRLSIRSLLSMKNSEEKLKVVEDFSVDSGKTKDLHAIALKLVDADKRNRVLLVDGDRDQLTRRAGRNIPWLTYFDASLLSTRELLYASQLVLTESAVKLLNEKYGEDGAKA
jgi:large subunit ribosomal protein L4